MTQVRISLEFYYLFHAKDVNPVSDSPRWVQSYELTDHREVSSAGPTEVSLTLNSQIGME